MARREKTQWQRRRDSHLATTYPRQARCGNCGAVVLSGLVGGLDTKMDPYLLNQRGEVEALVRGLRTYRAYHPSLTVRSVASIRREPVPRVGYIIREHNCAIPAPPEGFYADPPSFELPDQCPF